MEPVKETINVYQTQQFQLTTGESEIELIILP